MPLDLLTPNASRIAMKDLILDFPVMSFKDLETILPLMLVTAPKPLLQAKHQIGPTQRGMAKKESSSRKLLSEMLARVSTEIEECLRLKKIMGEQGSELEQDQKI